MIQENCRIKQREIALQLVISQLRVQNIIEMLHCKSVCTRWASRQLTDPMKEQRKTVSHEHFIPFCLEEDDFLKNVATRDESWTHHYDPENKMQSIKYRHPGSPCVKKFKTVTSATKFKLSIFWDTSGVLYTEFLWLKD
ncbi:uncharacterized protein TNCV_2581741 [Trichonephila clavipes]|nr:uncharacterized protein TNCV_2581741 [Trichonephila clavipes]